MFNWGTPSTFKPYLDFIVDVARWLKSLEPLSYDETIAAVKKRWNHVEEWNGPLHREAIAWTLCDGRFHCYVGREKIHPGISLSDKSVSLEGKEEYFGFHLTVGPIMSPALMETRATRQGRLARKFYSEIKQREGFESIDEMLRSTGILR